MLNKTFFKPTDKTTWKKLNDKVIIVDVESGHYYSLNDTASNIWMGLMENKSTTDVFNEMSKAYNISEETLETDIKESVSNWEKYELITENTN